MKYGFEWSWLDLISSHWCCPIPMDSMEFPDFDINSMKFCWKSDKVWHGAANLKWWSFASYMSSWKANNGSTHCTNYSLIWAFSNGVYIEARKAQTRVKMMAGLKDGLPPLFGGASVPLLVVDPGVVVVAGFGSTMVIPMVEHEIGSLPPGAFTLGEKDSNSEDCYNRCALDAHSLSPTYQQSLNAPNF